MNENLSTATTTTTTTTNSSSTNNLSFVNENDKTPMRVYRVGNSRDTNIDKFD